jgi:hypothetical protein
MLVSDDFQSTGPRFRMLENISVKYYKPGDRFTKVIVNRKSNITLTISLRARVRAFH